MNSQHPDRPRGRGQKSLLTLGVLALGFGGAVAGGLPAFAVDGGIPVTSTDMTDGTPLNPLFACSGVYNTGTTSPQLQWGAGPVGTVSYVVLLHDELSSTPNTAYDATQGDWAHWGVYNLPATTSSLSRNVGQAGYPAGSSVAANSWNSPAGAETRYLGPCPPSGTHNYYFTVYALDATITPTATGAQGAVTAADMLRAMQGHVLDQGDLQVTFDHASIGTTPGGGGIGGVLPVMEFASTTASSPESQPGALPKMLVKGTLAAPMQVTLSQTSGSATAGTDYTAPAQFTIPAGVYDGTAATAVAIPGFAVLDDTLVNGDRTATFSVQAADPALLGVGDADGDGVKNSLTTFTILDDDTAPATGSGAGTGGSSGSAGGSAGAAQNGSSATTAPTSTSGALAETGADSSGGLLVGGGSLAAGILAMGIASVLRRRAGER